MRCAVLAFLAPVLERLAVCSGAIRNFGTTAAVRIVLVGVACLVLAGCGTPKLDATTPQTTDASLARMRSALSKEQQEKFGEALMLLSVDKIEKAGGLAGPFHASLKPLHGKTAEEIIALAEPLLAQRRAKERSQALLEIRELEASKEAAATARVELAKFEVVTSRFSQQADVLGRRPLIQLAVKNGTPHTIARAFFRGTLASPGRVVPWLSEDFDCEVRGGLAPGESASWSLAPNRLSAWGRVDAPKDAILTVDVMKLAGADDVILLNGDFPAEKRQRLAALKEQYP